MKIKITPYSDYQNTIPKDFLYSTLDKLKSLCIGESGSTYEVISRKEAIELMKLLYALDNEIKYFKSKSKKRP